MKTILEQLQELTDARLFVLAEAVDAELGRREVVPDDFLDSARHRALEREESYRRRNGAAAPRVRIVGIKPLPQRRAA